jgi:hypothetical protein
MDTEIDRKVVLPRVRSIGSRIHWEPRPWKQLKRYSLGMTDEVPWRGVVAASRNARLLVPPSKVPLSRHDHMALKSLYVMLHEGYIIETNDRACCFVRKATDRRITTGASVILSTPFHGDREHKALRGKLKALIPSGIVIEDIRPYAICFREMTFDDGKFGPAYFWILHRVRCNSSVPQVRYIRSEEDSFVGAKHISSLFSGDCTASGSRLTVTGLCDRVVLGSLLGRTVTFPGVGFRSLSQADYDSVPAYRKPLVDERIVRMTAFFALPLLAVAWKLADEAGTAEWITQKLALALQSIQSTFQ